MVQYDSQQQQRQRPRYHTVQQFDGICVTSAEPASDDTPRDGGAGAPPKPVLQPECCKSSAAAYTAVPACPR